MINSLARLLCLCTRIVSASGLLLAQTVTAAPMPKDPAAILALALAKNGLNVPGLKPWHLRVIYQTFDENGQPKDTGVFEEWWAGPKQYKQSYTSKSFTRTIYVTDAGTFKTGDAGPLPLGEWLLDRRLLSPIPEPDKDVVLLQRKQEFGKGQLDCVVLARKITNYNAAPTALFPTYCFEPDKPMLRWSGSYGKRNSYYNKIGLFQETTYIAQDFSVKEVDNLPVVTAHIETLSTLTKVNDADFSPPADAVRVTNPDAVNVAEKVIQGKAIKKVSPGYPLYARQHHIEGKVIIQTEIGEDGRLHELTVISAPDPILAISSLVALQQWQYQPFLLNGEPVRVETQIEVVYSLK
jgi:TonB family protein